MSNLSDASPITNLPGSQMHLEHEIVPANRPDEIQEFFDHLYPVEDLEYSLVKSMRLTVFTLPDAKAWHFPLSELHDIPATISPLLHQQNIYFGVGLRRIGLNVDEPGKNNDVLALPGLYADIDFKGPGHKHDKLPKSMDEALVFANHCFLDLPPTLIVFSGGGIYPFWLFKEIWELEDEAERFSAQARAKNFEQALIRQGQARGWRFDCVSDLRRVLRLPGSLNLKDPSSPLRVKVLEYHPELRYNPGDFKQFEADIGAGSTWPVETTLYQDPDLPPADYTKIREACAWVRQCEDHAATLNEPNWYAFLSILARCKKSEDLAHTLSQPYPGYTSSETEKKLIQAKTRAGPVRCERIARELSPDSCANCPHEVTSPINLGRQQESDSRSSAKKSPAKSVAEKLFEIAMDNIEIFQDIKEEKIYVKFPTC